MGWTIQGDKHFVSWSGNTSKWQMYMLFKVNGHYLKIFLEPEKPPEDLDEVDVLILPYIYTTAIPLRFVANKYTFQD